MARCLRRGQRRPRLAAAGAGVRSRWRRHSSTAALCSGSIALGTAASGATGSGPALAGAGGAGAVGGARGRACVRVRWWCSSRAPK